MFYKEIFLYCTFSHRFSQEIMKISIDYLSLKEPSIDLKPYLLPL